MAILKFFVVLFLLKISATSTYPILLRCFSSIVAVYLMFGWKQGSKSEPYGSFHIELNRLPGSPKDVAPETEWLNMGYWKVRRAVQSMLWLWRTARLIVTVCLAGRRCISDRLRRYNSYRILKTSH
jgi:hypothetical protein